MPSDCSESKKNSLKKRIALSIQYQGTDFCGWQRQAQGISVQQVLEEAIKQLDSFYPLKTFASGRTDSGVHAAGQVVHFDCSGRIPANRWAPALNGRLPRQIRVLQSVSVPLTWHACHSAIYRRYRYLIYNGTIPNLFLGPWSWHRYQKHLDEDLMRVALEQIIGLHDFAAFQRSGSNRPNSFTKVQEVSLDRDGDLISVEIQASGFLYGMVRLLVGQLVALGENRLTLQEFEKRWKERLRNEVKEAAPAKGLCFIRAGYPHKIFSSKANFDCMPKFVLFQENSFNRSG